MNANLLPLCLTSLTLAAAGLPAQADRAIITAPTLPAPADAAAADRVPTLEAADRDLIVQARPGEAFALLAGLLRPADADRVVVPLGVIATGCFDEDGDAILPMPILRTGDQAADVVLQLVVSPDGITFRASPALMLTLRPVPPEGTDGTAPALELDNQLPPNHPARAELVSTDSIPPQFAVRLEVDAPTTGYSLRHAGTENLDSGVRVVFELNFPNPALSHLPVIETLAASADLGTVGAPVIEVIVRSADVKGNVQPTEPVSTGG